MCHVIPLKLRQAGRQGTAGRAAPNLMLGGWLVAPLLWGGWVGEYVPCGVVVCWRAGRSGILCLLFCWLVGWLDGVVCLGELGT